MTSKENTLYETVPGSTPWPKPKSIAHPTTSGNKKYAIALMAISLLPILNALPKGLTIWMTVNCLIILLLANFFKISRPIRMSFAVTSSILIAIVSFSGLASSMQEMAYSYAALMLCMKTMEITSVRDLRVISIMSIIPSLICLIDEANMLTGIISILIIPSSISMLIFVCDIETDQRNNAKPSYYLKKAGKTLLLATPLALIAFYFLPRLDSPLWGHEKTTAGTGMSETMSPGNYDKLFNDPSVAFRAIFRTPLPVGFQAYWRGPVLTKYNGETWSTTPSFIEAKGSAEGTGTATSYKIMLEPQKQPYIPALDIPLSISPRAGLILNNLSVVSNTTNGQWRKARTIDMSSAIEGRNTIKDLPEEEKLLNLELPAGYNPRAIEFARQLRQASNSEEEYVTKIASYYRSNLTYTLEPPLLGKDRVDELLFVTKQGFCEHFSSSFVVLMRAAGVPARIVTGYQGGEINENRDFYTVRQLYAHAWSEVWFEGKGWTRIDPTGFVVEQRPIDPLGNNPLLKATGLIGLSRWISDAWGKSVGNFNSESQRYFAEKFFSAETISFSPISYKIFMILGGATLFLIGFMIVLNIGPRNKKLRGDPLEEAWHTACDRLRKIVPTLPLHITAQAAAKVAEQVLNNQSAQEFNELSRKYSQAQYEIAHASNRKTLAYAIGKWRPKR